MILSLALPRVGDGMHTGKVHRIIARVGEPLRPGAPLLEVRVDLSQARAQDCPPLFFFRLIATERAWLRVLAVTAGDVLDIGALLGIATTTADEHFDAPATRGLRTTAVSIQIDPLSR